MSYNARNGNKVARTRQSPSCDFITECRHKGALFLRESRKLTFQLGCTVAICDDQIIRSLPDAFSAGRAGSIEDARISIRIMLVAPAFLAGVQPLSGTFQHHSVPTPELSNPFRGAEFWQAQQGLFIHSDIRNCHLCCKN
jgi:hypothetical protein